MWIALADEPRGEVGLALADLIVGIKRLSLKVGKLDAVIVDDRKMANTNTGQGWDRTCTDAASTNYRDVCRFQSQRPRAADAGRCGRSGLSCDFSRICRTIERRTIA